MVWLFRHRVADTSGLTEIATVFLIGLQSDVQSAAELALPGLALSMACLFTVKEQLAERVRRATLFVMIAACVVVSNIYLGHFREFHNCECSDIFGTPIRCWVSASRWASRNIPVRCS